MREGSWELLRVVTLVVTFALATAGLICAALAYNNSVNVAPV